MAQEDAALKVQALARGSSQRRENKAQSDAAVSVQTAIRGKAARMMAQRMREWTAWRAKMLLLVLAVPLFFPWAKQQADDGWPALKALGLS